MNPHYDYDKLGWEMLSFEEDLSYEFNILCFWKTETGQIYSASDSGCSCPTPFEDYTGSKDEILQSLERVGSLEQAEQIFDSWNKGYGDKRILDSISSHQEIKEFAGEAWK